MGRPIMGHWVTVENAANTRMITGWLIKKFIDPQATFSFRPKETDPSTIKDGTPFHFPGGEFSTHDGVITYQRFMEKYKLLEKNPPALAEVVKIYAAANKGWRTAIDTPEVGIKDALPADAPVESGGLLLALVGIRLGEKDDGEKLRKAYIVFDALYDGILIRTATAAKAKATA
jgi:hypothetical protein